MLHTIKRTKIRGFRSVGASERCCRLSTHKTRWGEDNQLNFSFTTAEVKSTTAHTTMSLLSIREGESGNHHHHHHKAKKEPSSSKALLFEKVKEAEERLVRSGCACSPSSLCWPSSTSFFFYVGRFLTLRAHRSDAVEESLVIISPHGLNPKVKRLVLKPHCLTILVPGPPKQLLLFIYLFIICAKLIFF